MYSLHHYVERHHGLKSDDPRHQSVYMIQYGPFVMNSQEEIYQALSDFRDGRLGEFA